MSSLWISERFSLLDFEGTAENLPQLLKGHRRRDPRAVLPRGGRLQGPEGLPGDLRQLPEAVVRLGAVQPAQADLRQDPGHPGSPGGPEEVGAL